MAQSKALKMAAQQKAKAGVAVVDPNVAMLQERALLARLSCGRWYGTMNDETVVDGVRKTSDSTGDIGVFVKRLMQRQHLAGINAVVNDARRYHKAMTLQWTDQLRILSAELFMDYKKTMSDFQQSFEKEVRTFLTRFDELKAQEKVRLGKLYRETDYPSHDRLKERFYMTVQFEPIPDQNDFRIKLLGGDDLDAIKKNLQEQFAASFREATIDLWKRLHTLVKKLRDTLATSDAGVRTALFDNLKEIVAVMPRLNIVGDAKLEALTKRVQSELLAESVESIKDDDKIRKEVADKADAILGVMESFIGADLDGE